MKIAAKWISGIAVVSLAVLLSMTFGLPVVRGQAQLVRWDIISINFPTSGPSTLSTSLHKYNNVLSSAV